MIRGYQPKAGRPEQENSRPKGGSAAEERTVKISVDKHYFCNMCYRKGYREGFTSGDKNAFIIALNILETEKKAVADGAYGPETALDFTYQALKALMGGEE